MKPCHDGIYWVKVLRRFTIHEPEEGITHGWECLEYHCYELGQETWLEFGEETDVDPEYVVEIGPEVLPPPEPSDPFPGKVCHLCGEKATIFMPCVEHCDHAPLGNDGEFFCDECAALDPEKP